MNNLFDLPEETPAEEMSREQRTLEALRGWAGKQKSREVVTVEVPLPPVDRNPARAVAVYSDAGCIGPNPSPHGGTWAFCFVDAEGNQIVERSGVIRYTDFDWTGVANPECTISCPVSELYALVTALMSLPNKWTGHVYSDCENALKWVFMRQAMNVIPRCLTRRTRHCLDHLGVTPWTLLAGHPSKKDLEAGYKIKPGDPRQWPVSIHNKWCDKACTAEAEQWKKAYL